MENNIVTCFDCEIRWENDCPLCKKSLPKPKPKFRGVKKNAIISCVHTVKKIKVDSNKPIQLNGFNTHSNIKLQYKKQNECCFYCQSNVPFRQITRDHFMPLSRGGKCRDNIVLACKFCNSLKSNHDIVGFRFWAKDLLERTMIFETADKLRNIIKTCDAIINKEKEVDFVKYGNII